MYSTLFWSLFAHLLVLQAWLMRPSVSIETVGAHKKCEYLHFYGLLLFKCFQVWRTITSSAVISCNIMCSRVLLLILWAHYVITQPSIYTTKYKERNLI